MPEALAEKKVTQSRFKNVANNISIGRIVVCIALLFWPGWQGIFFVLYLACGLSDVLDGYIARKTNTQSALGARLDSIGDFFLALITIKIMVGWLGDNFTGIYPVLAVIVAVRLFNVIFAGLKYHTFAVLHTWANKATGLLFFVTPLIYLTFPELVTLYPVCILALLAAVEESFILVTAPALDVNRRSIFKT